MGSQARLPSAALSTMNEPTITIPLFPSTSVVAMNITTPVSSAGASTTLSTIITVKSTAIDITSSFSSTTATAQSLEDGDPTDSDREKWDIQNFISFMVPVGITLLSCFLIIVYHSWTSRRKKHGKLPLIYKLPKFLRPKRYKEIPPNPPIGSQYTNNRPKTLSSNNTQDDINLDEMDPAKVGRRGSRQSRSSFGQSFPPRQEREDIGVYHWEKVRCVDDPTMIGRRLLEGQPQPWRPESSAGSSRAVAMVGVDYPTRSAADNGERPSGADGEDTHKMTTDPNSSAAPTSAVDNNEDTSESKRDTIHDDRTKDTKAGNNATSTATEASKSLATSQKTAAGSNAAASTPSIRRGSSDSGATEADPDETGGEGTRAPEARDQLVLRNDYCQNQ